MKYKITIKLVRSFSIGVSIRSPKLNGISFDVMLGVIHVSVWSKGKVLLGFNNYWNG